MRVDPVRREEVRLTRVLSLAATPADAWRRVQRGTRYQFEPIPELFAPLLAELAAADLPRAFDEGASWLVRNCGQCGRRFFIVSGWYRGGYCSDHCAQIAAKASMRRQTAKRAAARRQLRAGRVCAHCGVPIEATHSTKRFCSDICRVKAHRGKSGAGSD